MITDFRDLLRCLVDNDVRFLVVGAHALAAHGIPRVTGDLDVWVEATDDNAARTWRALTAFGAPVDSLGIRIDDFSRPDQVIQLGLPPFRVDILTSISGVSWDEGWADRLDGTLLDVPLCFLGRKTFIQNKRASGRPKDLEDIRSLERP